MDSIIVNNLPFIITMLLGLGMFWRYAKKGIAVLKELVELLNAVTDALEDRKITAAELKNIRKEAHDILIALQSKS